MTRSQSGRAAATGRAEILTIGGVGDEPAVVVDWHGASNYAKAAGPNQVASAS
jgi:hypothetical protein